MTARGRDRWVESVIEAGSAAAVPRFATGSWPDAPYRLGDRHGVGVMALPTSALGDDEKEALLRFRFSQYLAAGFVDPDVAYRERLQHEPVGAEELATVHLVAYSSAGGRILANLALRSPAETPRGTTLRTPDRPLLPLEEHFGWGALNRLHLLPDIPLGRVRELGRFVKNHRLGELAELGVRAVVEVCLAAMHVLTGPLRLEVEAFVGEFEDAVARRHLEFFHTPFAMVRGGLPAFEADHFLAPALDGRARYPFAVLISDMAGMAGRVTAIEAALEEPGIAALAALAGSAGAPRPPSSLVPAGGMAPLADTPLPQRELAPGERRRARALGRSLRSFAALAALSDTECTTLHGLLEHLHAPAGETIVQRGEPSDAIFLIGDGLAEVRPGGALPAALLGPGDCFGEIGLLTGAARSADVVARSALSLLRLSAGTYRRYLGGLPDIPHELARIALARAAAQLG